MSCAGLGRYVSLAGAATSYARRITRLRNRILGEPARPTSIQSEKVVKLLSALPKQKDPQITNYYPRHVETYQLMMKLRNYGLFRDEHEDFKEEMKRLRALRGKAKPKKGEGKRASKK